MNALILGGQSRRHYHWVRQVSEALTPHFETVRFLDYRHWRHDGQDIDIRYEVGRAAQLAEGWGEYVIVAKSIGSVVATLATARGRLSPVRCVFMGFPLRVVEQYIPQMDAALPALPPTVFLQNQADPLGGADEVRAYIETHPPKQFALTALPGETHDYTDFDLITRLATVKN